MKIIFPLIAIICMIGACTHEPIITLDAALEDRLIKVAPTKSIQYFSFPEPGDLNAIPNQESANPLTSEKVKLGKLLFYETGLAQNPLNSESLETFSCSSCHIPSAGFTPGRFQGVADGAIGFGRGRQLANGYQSDEVDAQGVRPLSVLNSAYSTNALWSGTFGARGVNVGTEHLWDSDPVFEINHSGFEGLEAQNIEGLKLHRMEINPTVLDEHGYRALFDEAFPDFPQNERYSEVTASFALAAYLRTLFANEAPFQKYLNGDMNALTESQKRGALVFFEKANCYKCHNGPAFSNVAFYALGTADLTQHSDVLNTSENDKRNLGRGSFTGLPDDNYKFKVPQLYNLKSYSHFFHGSSKETLEEVIDFKLKADSENPNIATSELSGLFTPVRLSDDEKADLLDFLKEGLYDPNLNRYVPEEILSGNCFPNNDAASRAMLGCD